MSRYLYIAVIFTVFLGYFGKLSPHPLSLLSSAFVAGCIVSLFLLADLFLLRFRVRLAWGLALVLTLLTLANWWHYQYFQSFFNYEVIALFIEAPDSLRSVAAFDYFAEALVLLACIGAMLVVDWQFPHRPRYGLAAKLGALGVALGVSAASGVLVHNSISNYKQLGMFSLSPAYLHPAHAFFVSTGGDQPISADEKAAAEVFFSLRSAESEGVKGGRERLNVIVLMLESVRASELGVYSGSSLSPNIDAFAADNILARNFYANTNYTVKGETATWCGIFDHNAKPPLAKSSEQLSSDLNCLPRILADAGYRTRFYHGYQSWFYGRDAFLPKVGFQSSLFYADQEEELGSAPQLGWGISDEAMMELMLGDLQTSSAPFFAHITTLSSHYPFFWGWPAESQSAEIKSSGDKLYDNYRNAVEYEDYAFGKFWQAFQQSSLADNTIVVLTADHGVWAFDPGELERGDSVRLDEKFFRVPLIIYHPKIAESVEVEQVSSQIDIAPTLLAMLGMPRQEFVGKDILNKEHQSWALMMKSGQLVARIGDMICRIRDRACSGLHQECVAYEYGEILATDFADLQACYRLEGDLLRGGNYREIDSVEPWLQRGFRLINYQNKRALGRD